MTELGYLLFYLERILEQLMNLHSDCLLLALDHTDIRYSWIVHEL